MLRLCFTEEALLELVEHCRQVLPNEACGFLTGRSGKVQAVYPVRNTDPSPEWFSMDPLDQMRAFEEIESRGEELLALYHSHPRDPARPSRADLEHAAYPDLIQVIVSLQDVEPVVRAYQYKGLVYEEAAVHLLAEGGKA